MTQDTGKTGPDAKADGESWERIARDWLDLWERELEARLSDPSQIETISGMMADWIGRFDIKGARPGDVRQDQKTPDETATEAKTAPSGAPAAAVASGLGLGELDIARRLRLLEDRLDRIEKRLAGKSGARRSLPAKSGKPHGGRRGVGKRGAGKKSTPKRGRG